MLGQLRSLSIGVRLASFSIAALCATPASAQPEIFPSEEAWTVQPAFGANNEGRSNVSGATCFAIPPAARTPCLVVNDQTTFAQAFQIVGRSIHPGATVGITAPLPPGTLALNPNMEGAANDGRFFYVVTSRGRALTAGQTDPSFLVARFPVDAGNSAGSHGTIGNIEISNRIRTALGTGIPVPGLPVVPRQRIDRSNAEIQGIAIRERQARPAPERVMHLGLRAPVLGGKAFIVSVPVDEVFATAGALDPTVTALALGDGVGIRDLAAVSDGLLILAGPGPNATDRPLLFHWNDASGELKLLGVFAAPDNRNGEALVVLQEDAEFIRFLVMFDGLSNGGPTEFFVNR